MNLDAYINQNLELREIMAGIPQSVKRRCALVRFQAGTILFYKGDLLEGIFLLCEGKIKVMNIFSKGNVYIVGEMNHITFVGEQAILAGEKKASVTVEAAEDSVMIRIPIDAFLEWVDKDHELAKLLLKRLAKRQYSLSLDHGERSYQSCSYLLGKYLIKVYEKSPELEVRIIETRQTIADKIGISLRSVEREIQSMREHGLITIRKRKAYINEEQYHKLVQMIEENL